MMHDTEGTAGEASAGRLHDRPIIVMLLANEFVHDTRVFKEARSLIEWGCTVHVLAVAKPGLPDREVQDGILVHRLAMPNRGVFWLVAAMAAAAHPRMLRTHLRRSAAWMASSAPLAEPLAADLARKSATAVERSPLLRMRLPQIAIAKRTIELGRRLPGPLRAPAKRVYHALCAQRREVAPPSSRALDTFALRTLRKLMRITRRLLGVPKRMIRRIRQRAKQAVTRWSGGPLRVLRFNEQLAAYAQTLQPDVVEAHDLNTLLGGALVKRATGCQLMYDSHELYLERNIGDRPRWRDRLFWAPVERACIVRCDAVITVAEGIARHLANQYGIQKPALVRNVQPFEPPAPRTTLLADELGIDRRTRLVIYPGAITINRGIEFMIDAAPMLDRAAFVIMGYARNSSYMDSLVRRARENSSLGRTVFFRDAVPIDHVLRYVASTDLGIVPTQNVCLSYYFESSNKIFHCLMAGVPVAMSDHAEKRFLVEDHEIGVLFDERDPQAIARAVNDVLNHHEKYAQLRCNCLHAARMLNWEHEEHRLRSIVAGLLGERARPVPEPRLPDPRFPEQREEAILIETGGDARRTMAARAG